MAIHERISAFERVHDLLDGRGPNNDESGWYTAQCPAHQDSAPSLSYRETDTGDVVLHCFKGCTRGEILQAMSLHERDMHQPGYRPTRKSQEFTLIDLAVAKLIDHRSLFNYGVTDGFSYHGHSALRIEYRHRDGSPHTKIRIRTGASGHDSQWDKSTPGHPIPYGVWKLGEAERAGYLLIGEGESDAWTCWLHDVPYLGIPGATNDACLEEIDLKQELAKVPRVYILQEPDQVREAASLNQSGKGFYARVRARLRKQGYQGAIFYLDFQASTGYKDPNALHQALLKEKAFARFPEVITLALEKATPAGDDHGEEEGASGLPGIIIGGQLRDRVAEALEALRLAESQDPTLFVQEARLIQVAQNEEGRPILLPVDVPGMKNKLTHAANFFREKRLNAEEVTLIPVSPPKELAEQILALNPAKWPFPALEAIIEAPGIRPDGTILDTPGYDQATRLYYAPTKGMERCKVPDHPTEQERAKALALIQEVFHDFPYVGNADRTNVLALLFTPFLRPAFKGHIPLALLSAPKPGSGKGMQAEVISILVTGDTCPILTPPETEEEWQKSITAELLQGPALICIDNVSGLLKSTKLEGVLTAKKHKGRMLGVSKMVTPHNKATWMATGNNIRVGGDLGRRCYRISIDPGVSQPWRLDGFLHEDLIEWVTENRTTIINSILTLIRAWFVAGKPIEKSIPKLASFSQWARMVGSVLAYAGVNDFLGNLDELQEEVDQESAQWERFFSDWYATFGDQEITTGMLEQKILAGVEEKNVEDSSDVAGVCENFSLESLPEYLATCLKEKPASFRLKLAHQLAKRVDACFGKENYCLKKREDKHLKKPVWKVVAGVAGVWRENAHPNLHKTQNTDCENQLSVGEERPSKPPQPPQTSQKSAGDTLPENTQNGSTRGLTQNEIREDETKKVFEPPQRSKKVFEPPQTSGETLKEATPEEDAMLQAYEAHLRANMKAKRTYKVHASPPLVEKSGLYLASAMLATVRAGLLSSESQRREAALDEMYFQEHLEYRSKAKS